MYRWQTKGRKVASWGLRRSNFAHWKCHITFTAERGRRDEEEDQLEVQWETLEWALPIYAVIRDSSTRLTPGGFSKGAIRSFACLTRVLSKIAIRSSARILFAVMRSG